MTRYNGALRLTLVLGACTALAGCLGSGGGGGGGAGGPKTPAAFDAEYTRITGIIPTSDMPKTGTATYDGTMKTQLSKGATAIGTLLADLTMTVDFAREGRDGSVTGEATNFHGTVDGKDVKYEGKLTTADAAKRSLPSLLAVVETTIDAPVVGPITLRPGSVSTNMTGDLTVDGKSGVVILGAGGAFVGPGGQAIYGPVVGTWWGPQGPGEYSVAGTWYAEK